MESLAEQVVSCPYCGEAIEVLIDHQEVGHQYEEGITFDGKIGQGQGVGIARNGDVWIADSQKDQLMYFPGGDYTKGKLIKVDGLHAPFAV